MTEARDLAPHEPVISVQIGNEARAYPLRIMIWHEIVNDAVGETLIAVTWCPLCNSSVVFDRRVASRTLSFGTTGKLRNSDLVMYDRETDSWWQQFGGECIIGDANNDRTESIAVSPAGRKHGGHQGIALTVAQREEKRHLPLNMCCQPYLLLEENA